MKTNLTLALPCCLAVALLASAPVHAADTSPNAAAPCGKLVAANETDGPDAGFVLRNGEQVDFVSGGVVTRGTLLVFHDGPLFRAYWQPQQSEEKYVLANAGPGSVRLVSAPPQGVAANSGEPGIATQPLLVLSCPKLQACFQCISHHVSRPFVLRGDRLVFSDIERTGTRLAHRQRGAGRKGDTYGA